MSTRKRNKIIAFRVSDEEYEAIQKLILASGLSKQAYGVNAFLNAKVSTNEEIEAIEAYTRSLNELRSQIRKIGNNINQIARRINQGGMTPTLHELYDLANKMNEIKNLVNRNITFDINGEQNNGNN